VEEHHTNPLSQLLLATLKCVTRDYVPYVWWANLVGMVIVVRHYHGQDRAALRFLTCLEAEVYKKLPLCDPPVHNDMAIESAYWLEGSFRHTGPLPQCAVVVVSLHRGSISGVRQALQWYNSAVVASPPMVLANLWDQEHSDHILSHDHAILENDTRRAMLLAFFVDRVQDILRPSKPDPNPKLAELLERKLL
jgi:hypothetical protein